MKYSKETSLSKIRRLTIDLKEGVTSTTIDYLEEAEQFFQLELIRTHKLLLINKSFESICKPYLQAVRRLKPKSVKYAENYIKFLAAYVQMHERFEIELFNSVAPYLNRRPKDFIYLVYMALGEQFEIVSKSFSEQYAGKDTDIQSLELRSEFQTTAHNILRGVMVDSMFALTRLINFYAINRPKKINSVIINHSSEEDKTNILTAVQLASRLNSILYALDRITYGECEVDKIKVNGECNSFIMKLTDFNFEKARDIGIKRMMWQQVTGKRQQGWLANMVEPFALDVLAIAWEYYQDKLNILISGNKKWESARTDLVALLNQLSYEDYVLFSSNLESNEIISHYFTVIALVAFVSASRTLGGGTMSSYLFSCPPIPKSLFGDLHINTKDGPMHIINKIDDYIQLLPARHHMDYFTKPYIQDKNGEIYSIDLLAANNWPDCIRTNLVQGGKTGAIVGKIWESYVADTLKKGNWAKVAQNVKLTYQGRTITDIDIIAKKNDLLLLIQLKVHYGTGNHTFEQWKFKEKLIHGVTQVKVSEENILSDLTVLKHYYSQNELNEIKIIKPIVMTNSNIFNGWKYDGVSIVSFSVMLQWINGAQVTYSEKEGHLKETRKMFDNINTKEILDLINKPLDWRIGGQKYETKYHTETFDNFSIQFPFVENKTNMR